MPSIVQTGIRGGALRTTICVDEFRSGDCCGRLYSPVPEKSGRFAGFLELAQRMDDTFDLLSFPQRSFEPRTFSGKKRVIARATKRGGKEMDFKHENQPKGEKATFVVQVQFRQNATWQGTIDWVEKKNTQRFRSMLELLKLMGDAVSTETEEFASWQETPAALEKEDTNHD